MRISVVIGSILIAFALVLISDTAYAAVAGRVQFVAGDVKILSLNGSSRVASKGTEVHAGETILTGLRSSAQLRMIDNGFISVRSRSELKIDEYRYEGSKSDSSFFSLVKGNFRALTGMIAKFNRDAWKTRTATAVLGVRGSDADIGFQPTSQLTAVRTLTGGYTLTPRDQNLPPLDVNAGGIGVFSPGSPPMMAASFPFEPPAPPPQPEGGASPHDQRSSDTPPEDERPLPPAPTHVPGVAPGPVASSTTPG
ncbi:FecR domain-containing protein, partial [Pseudomonadota bacterium]